MVNRPRRDEVWLVSPDPTVGSEIQKSRPCLVVSPDELNQNLRTVIVAPMTTAEKQYATRVSVTFQRRKGQVAVDQIRTIDRERLVRRLGVVPEKTGVAVSAVLVELFQH